MPITLPLGSGVHGNRWVLANCCLPNSLFFSAAFSLLFHWCLFVSSEFVLIRALSFCPSPAPQRPGVVLPLYRIQMHGKLDVETTTSCLGHGTPPSSSSFSVICPNQVCLITSINPLFSCSYLSCSLASFSQLCYISSIETSNYGATVVVIPSAVILVSQVSSFAYSCSSLTSFSTGIVIAFPSLILLHSVLLDLVKLQLVNSPVFHLSASIFTSQP